MNDNDNSWGGFFRSAAGDALAIARNELNPNPKPLAADRAAVESAAKYDLKTIGIGLLLLVVVAIVVKKVL